MDDAETIERLESGEIGANSSPLTKLDLIIMIACTATFLSLWALAISYI